MSITHFLKSDSAHLSQRLGKLQRFSQGLPQQILGAVAFSDPLSAPTQHVWSFTFDEIQSVLLPPPPAKKKIINLDRYISDYL